MKKLILASVISAAALSASAQKLEIIPKAGINIAKHNADGLVGEKFKVGFQGGVGLNIAAGSSGLSFQPEINFVNKGTKVEFAGTKTDLKLNYIEVPVLAKYTFGPVYLNAGPSIAMMLDKESKFVSQYASKPKRFEFGVQMGAGVAIPAGPGKFFVDGRYALGLTKISKTADVKNRGIIASIGYAIPLGGKSK